MTRYASMFERCAAQERGAIVPFVMLGDPTPASCEAIIEALIADGADALELGIPFSDPVADGVVIQEAHLRALQAGTAIDECFRILSRIRDSHPDLPIGLLVYANVPFSIGVDRFYELCAQAGVDSVLIPDLPSPADPRGASIRRGSAQVGDRQRVHRSPIGLASHPKRCRALCTRVRLRGLSRGRDGRGSRGLDRGLARGRRKAS